VWGTCDIEPYKHENLSRSILERGFAQVDAPSSDVEQELFLSIR
jgi:hypothetical protein